MKRRTPKQIQVWLRTRLWYNKYKANLKKTYDDPGEILSYLTGYEYENTISTAFCWKETPEGVKYWGKREKRFLRWYYHQGIELFRCKWFIIQIK